MGFLGNDRASEHGNAEEEDRHKLHGDSGNWSICSEGECVC
jgi:hypothetical protein